MSNPVSSWPRWFRLAVLKQQIEWEHHGIGAEAKRLAGARTMPALLRKLAAAVVNQSLTEDERMVAARMLEQIAAGRDVRKALGIDPIEGPKHRPKSLLRHQIAMEVHDRIAEGDEPGAAIKSVAEDSGLDREKVRKDYELYKPGDEPPKG